MAFSMQSSGSIEKKNCVEESLMWRWCIQGEGESLLVNDKKAAMLENIISPTKSIARASSGERRQSSNLIKAIH